MKFDWTRLVSWIPFNQGKPKTQLGVLAIIIAILVGFCTQARSAESQVAFGLGSTVVRGQTAVINLALRFPDAGPKDADYEVGTVFIGQSTAQNGETQRNNFAWYGAIIDGVGRFDFGIGPAYLQNVDNYNGSHLNYTLLVGYRPRWRWCEPCDIRVQHFSNGGTQSPNKGRDQVYLRKML